jgi:hypothetical protein
MAIITTRVDNSARMYGRAITFDSGAGDFTTNDVIDVNAVIGGPGHNVVVTAEAGASCSFRINSMNKRYPLYEPARKLGYYAPDLQNETIWYNTAVKVHSLTAGQSMTIDCLPVSNLQFTAVSGTVTVYIVA